MTSALESVNTHTWAHVYKGMFMHADTLKDRLKPQGGKQLVPQCLLSPRAVSYKAWGWESGNGLT